MSAASSVRVTYCSSATARLTFWRTAAATASDRSWRVWTKATAQAVAANRTEKAMMISRARATAADGGDGAAADVPGRPPTPGSFILPGPSSRPVYGPRRPAASDPRAAAGGSSQSRSAFLRTIRSRRSSRAPRGAAGRPGGREPSACRLPGAPS